MSKLRREKRDRKRQHQLSQPKKERIPIIGIGAAKDFVIAGIEDSPEGVLTLLGKNGEAIELETVDVGMSYPRAKSPKIMNQIPIDPRSILTDPNASLQQFGTIVAVDTNTDMIGQTKVSIAVSFSVGNIKKTHTGWTASGGNQPSFEFHNATESPELIGWIEQIDRIKRTPNISYPVGIIVDAHLSKLRDINGRKIPILGKRYLPEGIKLIYASSDTGVSEYIPNWALSMCDKEGKRLFKVLRERGIPSLVEDQGSPKRLF